MTCTSTSLLPRGRRACAWMLAGVTLVVLAGCGAPAKKQGKQSIPDVEVAAVRLDEIAEQVPVVGTVTPSETSQVAAGVAGLVVAYPAREGEFIRGGNPLAQLERTGLEIEIEKATALMQQQEQVYREVLGGYRPEEVASAKAAMLAAAADFKVALARHRRLERGRRSAVSAISAEEYEEAKIEIERTRQAHAAATADYEMKSAGHRPEQIAAAKAALQALLQEVRRLEDQLKKHTVVAPFDGFVVTEHTDVGQWVDLGGVVAVLVRLDEVEVRVNVNESQVDQIGVGQTVDVFIDALGGRSMAGRVQQIVPRSEWQQGSRSFPVVVRMKNVITAGVPLLKEGMVARITFRGPPRRGLLAHKDAIVRSAGLSTVFVVDEDSTVRAVNVVEGLSEGEYIEVEGDLQAGDLLVTQGVERLRPYDQVAVKSKAPDNGIAPNGIAPDTGTLPASQTAGGGDESETKSTGGD